MQLQMLLKAFLRSTPPQVYLRASVQDYEILERAKDCAANSHVSVFAARAIKLFTKVFTRWRSAGYFAGRPGDYLVLKKSDPTDVYLVKGDIFDQLYAPC